MQSLSKVVNTLMGRLDLHLSRARNFRGLQVEWKRTQEQLQHTQEQLKHMQEQLNETLAELNHRPSFDLSQVRWRGDEADEGLTWGGRMVGDEFARFLLEHVTLAETSTIVEVGPGYGRILDALMARRIPFRRYIGLDISAARVNRLRDRFKDARIGFLKADILGSFELSAVADLTFSSAVLEHLYPDFSAAIHTISQFTRPGGGVVIDFVRKDDDVEHSESWFDRETYIRVYSIDELEKIFATSGFAIRAVERISFGADINNREITRTIVFATKGSPTGPTLESRPAPSRLDVKPFDAFVHRYVEPCNDRSLDPPLKPEFRTSFGGFWTDLCTADTLVAGKAAIGNLLPSEAKLIDQWIHNGYVILPGAVDTEIG